MKHLNKNHTVIGAIVGLAIASPQAVAQIEEVVVTATKRPENLLEVAGSIQVVTGDFVTDFRLENVDALVELVPNAVFNAAPSGTPVLAIRGLGTRPGSALLEQDVALFVDGVWMGRNNQLNSALIDVESIEILKGTQATLYGRNTIAGAVNVHTKGPASETEGYIRVGREFEYGGNAIEGAVSLPVSENFGLRVAARYEDEGGWLTNNTLNRDEPESENTVVRVTGVYETDGNTVFTGKAQLTDTERVGNIFTRAAGGNFTGERSFSTREFPAVPAAGSNQNVLGTSISVPGLSASDVGNNIDFTDLSLSIDHPIGEHTLTSVTAYSEMDLISVFDVFLGLAPVDVIGYFDEQYDQFTQEIRLTSPAGERLDYIVGAFYLDQTVDRLTYQYLDTPAPPPHTDRFWLGKQDVSAWAIFASGTWTLNDRVRLLGGLRFSDETKDADVRVHGSAEPDGSYAQTVETAETDFFSGSVGIEWDVSDTLLFFGGASRGNKAPGLADGAAIATNAAFLASDTLFIPEEEVTTLEAGIKWELDNGYVNATVFDMDVDNFQNAAFVGGEILVDSFDVSISGLEVDAVFYLSDRLSVVAGLGLLDAKNTSTTGNDAITSAPDFSSSLTASYETTDWLDGYNSRVSLNVSHKSSYFLNDVNDPNNELDGVTLINATFNIIAEQSGFNAMLSVKNLADEDYFDFAYGAPFLGGDHMFGVAQGRTLGLDVGYAF